MASGASGESVQCPNCKEDVPKTLYCLNCGFPLYKEEQVKEEKSTLEVREEKKPEAKAESIMPTDDAVIVVDDGSEEEKQEPSPEPMTVAAPEKAQDEKQATPIVEETTVQQVEPVPPSTDVEVKPVEPPVEVKKDEVPKPAVTVVPTVEAPQPPFVEFPTPATTGEPLSVAGEAPTVEAVMMVEEYQEEAMKKGYVPDPLSKELMENLSKSISVKLKLVKLYREGVVKEETFTKLFDEYLIEGKIWSTRHDEMLSKLSAEVEDVEDAYVNASEALELLEIKKSIGDVSDDEYAAKAPAYRWDIHQFDFLVTEKRNKIAYLENMGVTLSTEELKEMKELASLQYNTIDALQINNEETLSKVKQSLYDAIKTLG